MEEFKVPVTNSKSTTSKQVKETEPQAKIINHDDVVEIISDYTKTTPSEPKCSYIMPKWSGSPDCDIDYKLEVLKGGKIIEVVKSLQTKPYWVFGRLPANDIPSAHPTVSRFHAVIQYRPKKPFIFPGIPKKEEDNFNEGGSTRKYILQGPDFDEEPESELTVTELKEQRIKQAELKKEQDELQEAMREKEGITWGMSEDADEETDLTINPYASTNNEELFLDDPKKTLRGFFEREGLELEYKVDEMSAGTFVCRVELPLDDAAGKPITAEVCHKGKKKECVLQCALEACRILDRHGVLRQAHHEPMKRKALAADSDDDDDFLDRTGDIERKKMRKAASSQNNALTYEDLLKQEKEICEKLTNVEKKIARYQEVSKRSKASSNDAEDDLDSFMKNLSDDNKIDKTEIRKLRVEEQRLKTERQKVQQLIKIATPIDLPSIKNPTSVNEENKKKPFLPLFGKRNKTKMNLPRTVTSKTIVEKEMRSDEEEMEEEEEISNKSEEKIKETAPKSRNTPSPKKENAQVVKGPAVIPTELLKTLNDESVEKEELSIEDADMSETYDSNNIKKKRNRIRNRGKARENVDINDTEEIKDSAKYSGWIPPENQSGDGMTSLNKKFGY